MYLLIKKGTNQPASVKIKENPDLSLAIGGFNYVSFGTKQLVFDTGESEKQFTIYVLDNDVYEEIDKNYLIFDLVESVDAKISRDASRGRLDIDDNGDAGTFSFASTNFSVLENAGSVQLHILRLGGKSKDTRVRIRTNGGTAIPNQDYVALDTSAVFPEGVIEVYLTLLSIISSFYFFLAFF